MKILISGSTGFIGKHLTEKLLEKNDDVCVVIRPSTDKNSLNKKVRVYVFDNNVNELISYLKKEQFDGVIHLASLFLAQHKTEDIPELINSNVLLGTALLEAASKSNVTWFINTGTFWQHYKNKKYSPVNLYAATKQAFESIAQYYIETSSINFVTIKLSDTFGPLDTRQKILNLLLKISKTGEKLDMSPGNQLIDISYIDSVIDGYLRMIDLLSKDAKRSMNGKSFVVSSGKPVSLRKLAAIFEKVSNKKLNINWGGKEYRQREVMVPWGKGVKIPGWKPGVSLEKAIRNTIK
ncbi:MAG: NAD(P)-dependent oxidoreductase [Candidatus Paceibacterota bacterium]|jgi:nucleoside-diphosphate-sugar epimerase